MPVIPCYSGPRTPHFSIGRGLQQLTEQLPPRRYSQPFYTPAESVAYESMLSWLNLSPLDGPVQFISNTGYTVSPMPDGSPLNFAFNFSYSDVDINNLESTERIGVRPAGRFSDDTYQWDIGAGDPPYVVIGEVVEEGGLLIVHGIALTSHNPWTSWGGVPSRVENPIVLWQFDFGDSVFFVHENISAEPASSSSFYRSAPVEYSGATYGDLPLRIRAVDSVGSVSNWGYVTIRRKSVRFGSFVDPVTKDLFTAVNEGDNVRVSRFTGGMTSRELLASIPNARAHSLFRRENGSIVLAVSSKENGDILRKVSTDYGGTFS